MRKEYEVAAEWWANAIRGAVRQDNGDVSTMLLHAALKLDKLPRPEDEQVQLFKSSLLTILEARESGEFFCWDESNPQRGGAGRILSVDYDPCPELYKAAEDAGIKIHYCPAFPMKTVMWMGPGYVIVRNGYHAQQKSLMENGVIVTV